MQRLRDNGLLEGLWSTDTHTHIERLRETQDLDPFDTPPTFNPTTVAPLTANLLRTDGILPVRPDGNLPLGPEEIFVHIPYTGTYGFPRAPEDLGSASVFDLVTLNPKP
jgi:hypothetical protein